MLNNGLVWAVPSGGRWGCPYVLAYGGRAAVMARTNASRRRTTIYRR